MQLRRLVIAEAGRFPELGRTFYEQGPGRTIAALAATFERLAARGLLQLDDPLLAADAVQLADHVGAAEPRDAPRRRRPAGSRRPRPRRRRRRPHVPRRLRPSHAPEAAKDRQLTFRPTGQTDR